MKKSTDPFELLLEQANRYRFAVRPADELLVELQQHQIELKIQNENLRKTQRALQASRDRYRDLYDFAPVGYLTLDDRGLITELNHTATTLFKAGSYALLNRNISEYIADEDQPVWHLNFRNAQEKFSTPGCDLKFRCSDGSCFFARLDCRHTTDENGAHMMRITLTDITQQKEAEAGIAESRQILDEERLLFHAMLDNAPIGIWMLGEDGRIRFINNMFCRALGVSEQRILSAGRYSEVLPKQLVGNFVRSDRECFEQDAPHQSMEWLPVPGGGERLFEITKVKLCDHMGATTGLIGLAKDITERHRAEVLRAESEEKLRVIFEGTLDGIVLVDTSGLIVDCNPEFIRQSGMTLETLKQTRVWELRPSEKMNLAKNVFFTVMQTGEGGAAEFKYKKPNGKVMHVEVRGAIVSIGGKNYLQCITHDTTARLQAQNRLLESEEKLRVIFEGALDGILLVNAVTHKFVNGNPEICRMLGYSLDELTRVGVEDIHPPEEIGWIAEQFEMHMKGLTRLSADIPVRRRDGTVFYVDIKSSAVELGGQTHIVAIFRDITERRQAEEIRRISALKHRLLFESSQDALMTLAPPEWKYTSANEATLKLFAVPDVARFTALSPRDLSPLRQPDGSYSAEKEQEMIDTALRTGSHFFEWEHQRLDGRPFAASVLLTRMSLGDELFIQATVRDITEHKLRVRELKEYQELLRELAAQGSASREAELKHIAREMHDELGQLLTALRMDISLLRIRFGEQDPLLMKKVQDMLVLVDKAIRGVRNVTANLRPPALDLGISAAILWLGDQFNARATTTCTVHILDDPAGLDDASTLTLFRIVQESLTNVARHAQADSVEIRVGQSGDDICVEVEDDGCGFDPATMSAKISFGLMGMKERAMAVGGRVEIFSAPSRGTVVSVYIPMLQVEERN